MMRLAMALSLAQQPPHQGTGDENGGVGVFSLFLSYNFSSFLVLIEEKNHLRVVYLYMVIITLNSRFMCGIFFVRLGTFCNVSETLKFKM